MNWRWLAAVAASITAVACSVWLRTCPPLARCFAMTHRMFLAGLLMATMALALASLCVWIARTVWLLVGTNRALRQLGRRRWPARLRRAIRRTAVRRVACLRADAPLAFCAAAIRPQIFVSDGLLRHLRPRELDAVLLHEQHHAWRRDPLRGAASRAAAEVFFYVPLLRWWDQHRRACAELEADRSALSGVGTAALAGALWAVGSALGPEGAAAFGGAAELRVAQVLGEPVPRDHPAPRLCVASVLGGLAAITVTWCLVAMVGGL